MEMLAAAVLGIIQGLTEFLPISSSAHLILVPWLFGWDPEGLIFDVALHVGTSLAVLIYFWRDWIELAAETWRGLRSGDAFGNAQRRLAWFLVVGAIPAMVAGLTLEKIIEARLRSPIVPVVTLVLFGVLLYYAERRGGQQRSVEDFGWADALWIGFSQALALVPGVSRSGITISAAMLRDVQRTDAARYSFMLSTPVIVGAGILQSWRLVKTALHPALQAVVESSSRTASMEWGVLAIGVCASAVTGVFCIRYFLRYLQTRSFLPFVVYRFVLAAIVLALFLRS